MDRNTIVQQFDMMEQQVESLVSRIESVQAENIDLITRIKVLEKEVVKKEDAENQFQKEKDLIRSKVDRLLNKLGEFNKS